SENATFLVTEPDAEPSVLRVHRLGYHTEQEIASELAWMDALRAEAGGRTPRVLPAADGRRVGTVPEPGGADRRGRGRVAGPAGPRCARRPGCARRGCCRPPTDGGWSPCPSRAARTGGTASGSSSCRAPSPAVPVTTPR